MQVFGRVQICKQIYKIENASLVICSCVCKSNMSYRVRARLLACGERCVYRKLRPLTPQIVNKLDWIEGFRNTLQLITVDEIHLLGQNAAKNGWTRLLMWFLGMCHPNLVVNALDISARNGHEMQALLLYKNIIKQGGITLEHHIDIACRFAYVGFLRNILVVRRMFRSFHYNKDEFLVAASKGGNIKMMKLLARLGANDWNGCLFASIRCNKIRSIKLARKMGAHISQHALGVSIAWKQTRIQKLLKKWLRKRQT